MRGIWQPCEHIFRVPSLVMGRGYGTHERGSDSLDMTVEETEKGEKGDKNNG